MTTTPTPANTVPSTPDPAPQALVLAVLRAGVMIAGILGLTLPSALNNPNTLVQIAGAVSTLVGIVWQVVAEYRNAANAHANIVASIKMQRAVKLT